MRKNPDSYRHGNLANALVADALHLLETQGAESISLRELAERAGVSPRAPYVHFKSRLDLLREVARRGFVQLSHEYHRAGYDLGALGEVYVDFALKHPNLFRLMFGGLEIGDATLLEGQSAFEHLLETLKRTMDIPEAELCLTAVALWSFVHGLSTLRLERLTKEEVDQASVTELARLLTRAFISAGIS